MQAFGRLRHERWVAQLGRPETQLQLRLEQAIKDAQAGAKADAEAERKKILRAIEADAVCQAAEAERKKILQAIEADTVCQAAAKQLATSGPQEVSLQDRRQLVQDIFDIMDTHSKDLCKQAGARHSGAR